MENPDQVNDSSMNPCAICLCGMGARDGQAIFMAECSHTFHFHCISSNVAHGNLLCPLCNAHWRELPLLRPAAAMPPTQQALQPPNNTVLARPEHAAATVRSVEVERELVRAEATEDIAAARVAAGRGARQEAVDLLDPVYEYFLF